jgi:hypothetical protein
LNFDFITDKKLKELLERDFQELKNCIEVNATKSILILSGSIMEAVLIEYFLSYSPSGQTKEQLYKEFLGNLIDNAEKDGLLSSRDAKLAEVVKDFRNLIHPGREIRQSEKFSIEYGKIAFSLLTIIVDAIRTKSESLYGYTAKEVVERLRNDWSYRNLFGKIILKLNPLERDNLFNELANVDFNEKCYWEYFNPDGLKNHNYSNLEFVKTFILELKPLLPDQIIENYLKELVKEVEKGSQIKAISLFNLLHEELYRLGKEDRESIVIYMLSTYVHILEDSSSLAEEKTFSTIGKYIETQKSIDIFYKMVDDCIANFSKETKEMDVFEQIFYSLSAEEQTNLKNYLEKVLTPEIRKSKYISESFVEPAIKRKIINET